MASQLISEVPEHWAPATRPFLQRAAEFDNHEPLAAYFLRTHVAFVCMRLRKKDDEAGKRFLMKLLDVLEQEKVRLGAQLDGADGRTTLTRVALMLFAKADDEERAGRASLQIVRLFFTSSVLLEATAQFTEDGQMDRIAKEKSTYAKFTAASMKKALDAGVPYVSRNAIDPPAVNGGDAPVVSTVPPSTYMQREPTPPPPPPPPASQPAQPPPPAYLPNIPSSTTSATSNNNNNNNYAPPPHVSPPPPVSQPSAPASSVRAKKGPSAAGGGDAPSTDAMIDAQKFARQAVSALQFYDHATARKNLKAALQLLE